MAIVAVDLGSSPTGAGGDTNREAFTKLNTSISELDTRASTLLETVAGGAGFVNVSGAVELDLATGRAFHHRATGSITALTFANVPATAEYSASWTWVVWQDATGGRTLAGTPTVRFVGGGSFDDLNTTADAVTIFTFWQVGTVTYAALTTNGDLRQDAYRLSFGGNGSQLIVAERAETVALGSVTNVEADGTAGTGTLSYKKNGAAASGDTVLAAGDVLEVTMASSTTASAVAIPRLL